MPRRKLSSSITISEVARRAGVSIATVSRHINASGPVSEEAALKIDRVRAELNYTPNSAAQQLASNRTLVIGLVLNAMHNEFFGPLLFGVETSLRQEGYNLLVATTRPEEDNNGYLHIGPHNSDGLIIYADSVSDAGLERLARSEFPIVLIHRSSPEGMDIPSVTIENKKATAEIITHLIEVHGRRRIAFMHGPETQEDSSWRFEGYRDALAAHGIPLDPELILYGGFEREIAHASLNAYLDRKGTATFDAVFAGDDSAALGALEALRGRGITVPGDVSLVGFDDAQVAGLITPALTTVRAPTYQVGAIAVEKLSALITGQEIEPVTLLSTEIILRESCGCRH